MRLIRFAWLFLAATGVAATVLLGYAGVLGFLVWGGAATPLAWGSVQALARHGRAPTSACVGRASRQAAGLAVLTVGYWFALERLMSAPPQAWGAPLLGGTLLALTWALFAAQLVFAARTTRWMWQRLGPLGAA